MANEKRLIDANAFFDKLEKSAELMRQGKIGDIDLNLLIASTPTVDAVEVVHGRWMHDENYESWVDKCVCSVCNSDAPSGLRKLSMQTNYCPNCGAKMDGDNKCE